MVQEEENVNEQNCVDDARRELARRVAEAEEARVALASASAKLKVARGQHDRQRIATLQKAISLAREIHEGRSIAVDEAVARLTALLALDHAQTTIEQFESLCADVAMYSMVAQRAASYGACPETLRQLVKGSACGFAEEYSQCFPSFSKRTTERLDHFVEQLKANPLAAMLR